MWVYFGVASAALGRQLDLVGGFDMASPACQWAMCAFQWELRH